MSSYVNVRETYSGAGNKDAIQLNRWSKDDYSIAIDVTGVIDVTVQGTLDHINRVGAATPVWRDISGLTNVTADAFDVIQATPFEAIRVVVNSGAGSINFHVMQQGES